MNLLPGWCFCQLGAALTCALAPYDVYYVRRIGKDFYETSWGKVNGDRADAIFLGTVVSSDWATTKAHPENVKLKTGINASDHKFKPSMLRPSDSLPDNLKWGLRIFLRLFPKVNSSYFS